MKNKNIKKGEKIFQTRTLYTNNNKILARITVNEIEGNKTVYLKFKEENNSEQVLKISKESQMLEINQTNKESIESILNMLNFKKSKELKRNRYIYEKENVKFEIDDYFQPEMKVVAIEGEKEEVDKIYMELENLYKKCKI